MFGARKIIDGYIKFKIADKEYVHHLDPSSNTFDLSDLEYYAEIGKKEYGIQLFLKNNFEPSDKIKDPFHDIRVELISYHFEFE